MRALNIPFHYSRGVRRWLWAGCLILLLALLLPTTGLAAAPDPDEADPGGCAQCHPTQAATWGDSPHAEAQVSTAHDGVTCEDCHGAYVPDHPQNGVMQLSVDAGRCQDCHTTTYEQWHETAHAGAGVQCVSCHVPHSQETRLAEEDLCASCHREEAEHWVHHDADVHCTDCHISPPSLPGTETGVNVLASATAPDHRFALTVEACIGCHGQSVHDAFHETASHVEQPQLSEMVERTQKMAYELEDAKRTNRSLQTVSVVSLGFGLGTGGVLGAIFVLVVGYVSQRSSRT